MCSDKKKIEEVLEKAFSRLFLDGAFQNFFIIVTRIDNKASFYQNIIHNHSSSKTDVMYFGLFGTKYRFRVPEETKCSFVDNP